MTDLITLPRATVQQALEALKQSETWVPDEGFGMLRREAERKHEAAITNLKAALEQPEQANLPEEKLQAVAEYVGDKCAVWYGCGARDVEEVLRQSAHRGLVTLNSDTVKQPEQKSEQMFMCGGTVVRLSPEQAAALEPHPIIERIPPEEPDAEFQQQVEATMCKQPETITIQEAWEAAGGNPGIKASKEDLIAALQLLNQVCNEADQPEQEPIPFSGADEKPPVFGRRWRMADDGFGLQLDDDGPYVHIDDALSVLHAALEQLKPEPRNAEEIAADFGREFAQTFSGERTKPQQEQEPVALWHRSGDGYAPVTLEQSHPPEPLTLDEALAQGWRRFYAHPPRREWRSLSEEEIYPLYSEPSSDAEMVEFARAIEAALKEINT